jgi:hypothetical protein
MSWESKTEKRVDSVQDLILTCAPATKFLLQDFLLTALTFVGDRPRGPLKQWGNPHLNPRIEMS